MAFTEVLDMITVNRKLLQLTNPLVATYWAEIIEISKQVQRKKTFDTATGTWKLNRKFVEEDTGISLEDQALAEASLVKLGFMEVSPTDPNVIRLHMNNFIGIISGKDTEALERIKKDALLKVTDKAKAKKLGQVSTMKKIATVDVDDPEIVSALEAWVDAIYNDAKGFLTKVAINDLKQKVFVYASDKAVRLELFKIAAARGYKTFEYVLSVYESTHKAGGARIGVVQQTATEVSDTKF